MLSLSLARIAVRPSAGRRFLLPAELAGAVKAVIKAPVAAPAAVAPLTLRTAFPHHAKLIVRSKHAGPVHHYRTHKIDPEAHPIEPHADELIPPPPRSDRSWSIADVYEYRALQEWSERDPIGFWTRMADTNIDWIERPKKVFNNDNAPFFKWFEGGKLNVSALLLDRHVKSGKADKPAIFWEGEPEADRRTLTFGELHQQVEKFAGVLRHKFGVKKGDRVVVYMPQVPETVVALLACARLGAPYCIVFGGFSDEALRERISDVGAKVVITADGSFRRGKPYDLKPIVDKALAPEAGAPSTDCVENVIVLRRHMGNCPMKAGRDHEWTSLMADKSLAPVTQPAPVDANDTLFVMHTSGSTGKPKGVQHSAAGYILWAQQSFKWVFDLRSDLNDVFFSTGDLGWIMGHTSMYGPLALGVTTVQYEGFISTPDAGRLWRMCERYKVSQFYTAPTAVRLLAREGPQEPEKYDLSSIRVIGSAGEPIGPVAWHWFHKKVGGGKAPVADNWWQTETGGPTISSIPGATPLKPGSATVPLPGIHLAIVDPTGKRVPQGEQGLLVITSPFPSMLRTLYNADKRFVSSYFDHVKFQGNDVYFTGDGAYEDKDGYIWITGRVDDVINVAGHRMGTAEIEAAINHCSLVAESAVVARPDPIKGEAVVAYVVLKAGEGHRTQKEVDKAVHEMVYHHIGKIAHLDTLIVVPGLPKTRSGKVMRRLLRSIARGEAIKQDTSTLEDPATVEAVLDAYHKLVAASAPPKMAAAAR
eukprot:tig00021014_g17089.t1